GVRDGRSGGAVGRRPALSGERGGRDPRPAARDAQAVAGGARGPQGGQLRGGGVRAPAAGARAERRGEGGGRGFEAAGDGGGVAGGEGEGAEEGVPLPEGERGADEVRPLPGQGLPDRVGGDRGGVPPLREGPDGALGDALDTPGGAGHARRPQRVP